MRIAFASLALLLSACTIETAPILVERTQKSFVLSGDLTRADNQTYREIPFDVPAHVNSLIVELTYTGRQDKTVIDMGIRDPSGPRGWSGGNKQNFTISEFEATPSYTPGKIQPGTWTLVLGIPNIREGATSHYEARVTLDSITRPIKRRILPARDPVLSAQAGWRRGDFHTHTEHSDGGCEIQPAQHAPCPIRNTIEAALDARLDFVAVTDHNTFSHRNPLGELQEEFPRLLMIPGTEITTFHGHANALGLKAPLEFQLGSPRLPALANLLDAVDAQGAILSVNHPGLPSDESCMGCGWTVKDTDWSRIAAMEVVNGGSLRLGREESPTSGIPVWENLLNQGFHVTAIGGSDNHDATDRDDRNQSPIGKPATVVWANEFSTKAVLDGVRSGRVFIDLTSTRGSILDMEGRSESGTALMGGALELRSGEQARIAAKLSGVSATAVKLVSHNLTLAKTSSSPAQAEAAIQLAPGSTSGWIRAEARDAGGKLLLLGNPIYVRAK